jgi:hypothetical protein
MLSATFFALQTIWDGRRLIAPYYMPGLLILLSGVYYFFREKKFQQAAIIYPLIAVILIIASYRDSFQKIKSNSENLRQNLKGNAVFGLTPDWQNYIRMCQWAAENVPKNVEIGVRKPAISFVYTGRRFYGIYNVPVITLDSMIKKCSNLSTGYLIIDTKQWENKPNLQQIYFQIQEFNIGYITEFWKPKGETTAKESVVFEVYEIPEKAKALFENLQTGGINGYSTIDEFKQDRNDMLSRQPDWQIDYVVTDPDDLLQQLYKNNVHYVVLANLRKYEQQKTEYTINTVRRYLFYIQRKYPFKIRQIKSIGNDEEAYLFEIL